jgi:pimeloyl-ACP methyl ester carboxylesterase
MTTAAPQTSIFQSQPLQTELIEVGGVSIRFVAAGDGPPLVLLHGIGSSLDDWQESFAALAAGHRVYALDLIGFGFSGKPDVPYSLYGLARFLRHFLDAVNEHRPVTLIGNSLGGAVAQAFAAQEPGRSRALVLVSSAGFGRGVAAILRAMTVRGLGEWLGADNPAQRRQKAQATISSIFADPAQVTPERVALAEARASQPGASGAFLSVLRSLGGVFGQKPGWRADIAAKLAQRRLPMLIIWGEQDRILPARHLKRARRLYPHARTHLFSGTGHQAQTERAAEFTALTLEFLSTLDQKQQAQEQQAHREHA